MKGLAALVAAGVIALGAIGCGQDDDDGGGGGGGGDVERTAGFDGKTIKVGVLTPLTGPVAVIGEPLTAGNEVFFEAVNRRGGIAGKYKVEIEQADTQYEPDSTVQQYNRLKSDVVAFTQVLGTAPTLAVLPQLRRDKVLAAPASLDALWVREENLLPTGGPYQIQAINAIDYYVKKEDGEGKRICSMIQDDAYGEAGQAGVDFAAEQLGFEVAETQRFRVGAKDVSGQVARLRSAKCDAVFLVATPSDAGTIWGTSAQVKFAPRWIAQSPAWIDELGASPLAKYLQQTTLLVYEGTEWGDDGVPGMAEMIKNIQELRPKQEPDYYFSFGYNQARAMTAVLEKAVELGDLSREGILEASRQLGTVSFEGLAGDYRYGPAEERNPPRTSTIFEVDPKKPFGLARKEYQYESEAAKAYEFKKADI
ncbi:MAG TPA: ABC transporter substrate-binding protein [Solirubrobacteraceae bacterium]|jgi:ABC-type branched-subunit amino acid transport system substrate-binding protein|nr:ABC transporter substrate-binding protein [Solirubrobacteraceae bacterium]